MVAEQVFTDRNAWLNAIEEKFGKYPSIGEYNLIMQLVTALREEMRSNRKSVQDETDMRMAMTRAWLQAKVIDLDFQMAFHESDKKTMQERTKAILKLLRPFTPDDLSGIEAEDPRTVLQEKE